MIALAQIAILILGFLAVWITLNPPQSGSGRKALAVAFAFLTLLAVFSVWKRARDNAKEKTEVTKHAKETSDLAQSIKRQNDLLSAQNADLQGQVAALMSQRTSSSPRRAASASCELKADVIEELEKINRFLNVRRAKSPAHNAKYANDPQYAEKEEAYEVETSRQYVEQFWPSIQPLLQRAVKASITPEATESFATPGYFPEPKWWQAMLKPGYNELVLISQQLTNC
jgi:hypothetical protein